METPRLLDSMMSCQNLGHAVITMAAGEILDHKGFFMLELFFTACICCKWRCFARYSNNETNTWTNSLKIFAEFWFERICLFCRLWLFYSQTDFKFSCTVSLVENFLFVFFIQWHCLQPCSCTWST